jgi:NADP-dependent 3-hydroxy acid dehydrogenase YdfG
MVNAAISQIIDDTGRLDIVVHNARHMVLGPTEAFSVEQPSCRRQRPFRAASDRAALSHLSAQRDGMLVWVGSSSSRAAAEEGPDPLASHFAKAAEDAVAVSYAAELALSADTRRCPGAWHATSILPIRKREQS